MYCFGLGDRPAAATYASTPCLPLTQSGAHWYWCHETKSSFTTSVGWLWLYAETRLRSSPIIGVDVPSKVWDHDAAPGPPMRAVGSASRIARMLAMKSPTKSSRVPFQKFVVSASLPIS